MIVLLWLILAVACATIAVPFLISAVGTWMLDSSYTRPLPAVMLNVFGGSVFLAVAIAIPAEVIRW